MKSGSSGTSKRKRNRKIKVWLLIFTFLAGAFTATESRYAVMRVYNISIEPQNMLPENLLWGTLKPIEEKIWPLYWIRRKRHQELINDYYPVNLTISLSGWGKFRARPVPLKPKFKMYWSGKYWYVSNNNRAWLTTLKENKNIIVSEIDSNPILYWSSDRKLPLDLPNKKGNIMDTSLPIERIEAWYNNIKNLEWLESVEYIHAGVRGDTAVVEVSFNKAESKGVSILYSDEPTDWHEPSLAIKSIYPNISTVSKDIFIDTTYKGKILVKNKVQLAE